MEHRTGFRRVDGIGQLTVAGDDMNRSERTVDQLSLELSVEPGDWVVVEVVEVVRMPELDPRAGVEMGVGSQSLELRVVAVDDQNAVDFGRRLLVSAHGKVLVGCQLISHSQSLNVRRKQPEKSGPNHLNVSRPLGAEGKLAVG